MARNGLSFLIIYEVIDIIQKDKWTKKGFLWIFI